MITTIIFDFGEVQIKGLVGVEEYFKKYIDNNFNRDYTSGKKLKEVFQGKMTEDDYWKYIIDKYKWSVSIEEIKKVIRQGFREVPGTKKLIDRLKHSGYKLGILSVHGKEWIDYCEKQFGYHKPFNATLYSFEIGVCKPEREAYITILERLNSRPEESVFIDDEEPYLEGAKKVGMQTRRFINAQQAESELLSLGVRLKD